jgi:hypothetical protein
MKVEIDSNVVGVGENGVKVWSIQKYSLTSKNKIVEKEFMSWKIIL